MRLKTLTQRLIQSFHCQHRCDDLMFSFTCRLLSLYLRLLLSSSLTVFVVSNPPASVYCICPDSHCDRPPEAYVPPQLFYNGKVDYFDLQRLGGLLSHLKKTLKGKFDCFKEVQTGSYISISSVKKHSSLVCLEPAGGETFFCCFSDLKQFQATLVVQENYSLWMNCPFNSSHSGELCSLISTCPSMTSLSLMSILNKRPLFSYRSEINIIMVCSVGFSRSDLTFSSPYVQRNRN